MRRLIGIFICLPVLVGLSVLCLVGCAAPKTGTKPKSEVEKLINQLGNKNWEIREKVQEELIKLGKDLIEQYRKIKVKPSFVNKEQELETIKDEIEEFANTLRKACQAKDSEINMRINHIHQNLYSYALPTVTFISNREWGFKIYEVNTDGKNLQLIYANDIFTTSSAITWNQTGTKIIFASEDHKIYIMDADGKNPQNLTPKGEQDDLPTWNPDCTKIVFLSYRHYSEPKEVCIMDADGKNRKRLTDSPPETYKEGPLWNSDGTKIVFESTHNGMNKVYIMDADGKNLRPITKDEASDWKPVWSPREDKIAFVTSLKPAGLYVVDADGSNLVCLVADVIFGSPHSWNADGQEIIFVSLKDNNPEIFSVNVNTKKLTRLTTNSCWDASPVCSPYGHKIAFLNTEDSLLNPSEETMKRGQNLCIMDTDGKNQKKIADHVNIGSKISWKPSQIAEISALFAEEEKKEQND